MINRFQFRRFWLLLLALLGVSFPCVGQLKVLDLVSVAPSGGVYHECYVDILDSNTLANYYSLTESCLQYRNGVELADSIFSVSVADIYGYSINTWEPLDVYSVQTDGYLGMYYDGAEYEDPMGYSGSYLCGPFIPGLNGYPAIQYEWCPNGQYGYFSSGSILRYSGDSNLTMPIRPYVTPASSTVTSGKTTQFNAFRLDSAGNQTSAPAQVSWTIRPGGTAGGSVSASGLYSAPTTYHGATDTVVATGALCLFCSVQYTGSAVVTVSPPAPSITGISVSGSSASNSLQAGPNTQTVTLTGSNLDTTSPIISIASGGTGVTIGSVGPASPTSVSFQVTVASDTSAGTVTFRLQTNGLSVIAPVLNIAAMVAPSAVISFGITGIDVTDSPGNSPTPVLVGQQVYLSASVPAGISPTSIDWSIPGAAVGGFTAFTNVDTGQFIPIQTEQQSTVFYWLYAGTPLTVEYTYCVDVDLNSCSTSTASFIVSGPTAASLTGSPGPAELFTMGTKVDNQPVKLPFLFFGDADTTAGLLFSASMTLPNGQGAPFFAQLINYDNSSSLTSNGELLSDPGPANAPALDGEFPYMRFAPDGSCPANNTCVADSPDEPLFFAEEKRTFSATMYLMYYPLGTESTCNISAGECMIPAPLGSMNWVFAGDAVNTLISQNATNAGATTINNTTYVLNPCSGCRTNPLIFTPSNASTPNYGYPLWTSLAQ